jgi:putative hemin transport protein
MQIPNLLQIQIDPDRILAGWKAAQNNDAQKPFADIAAGMNITEAELMAARVGFGVVRLRPEWNALLAALPGLNQVRAVTTNSCAAIETTGTYPGLQQMGSYFAMASDGIDLRLSLPYWDSAFAVAERNSCPGETVRSICFYGKNGGLIHRVFLTRGSCLSGFDELVENFIHPCQLRTQVTEMGFGSAPTVIPKAVDKDVFLERWGAMKDTREFFALLREFRLSRQDAFQLGEARFTRRIAPELLYGLLHSFVQHKIPVLLLVGHSACVQVYRGLLTSEGESGNEVTVRASKVRCRFCKPAIAMAWLVDKPTSKGVVRSLELFDSASRPTASVLAMSAEGFLTPSQWEALLFPLLHSCYTAS